MLTWNQLLIRTCTVRPVSTKCSWYKITFVLSRKLERAQDIMSCQRPQIETFITKNCYSIALKYGGAEWVKTFCVDKRKTLLILVLCHTFWRYLATLISSGSDFDRGGRYWRTTFRVHQSRSEYLHRMTETAATSFSTLPN